MLNGIIINITRPNAAIFAANIFKTVRLNPIPAANKTHAAGINIENVAYPVSVTKYFSKNITTRIIRKYDVKSVSLFAIGVVASPGIAAMAVDAAADVAVSFRISAFFSSSASIVFYGFPDCLPHLKQQSSKGPLSQVPLPPMPVFSHSCFLSFSHFLLCAIIYTVYPTI